MKSAAAAAFFATMASALPLENSQISYSSVITTAHSFATTHQYDAKFQSDSSGNDYFPNWRPDTKPSGCASWATLGAYTRAFGNSCCSQGLLDYCGAQQNNFDAFAVRPVIWTQPKFYQDCYNVWQNPNELQGSRWVSVGGGGSSGQGFSGFQGGSKDYNGGSSQDYNEGSKDYNGGSKEYNGGSQYYNGGSKDYNEGSKDYEGGSQDYDKESKDWNGGLKDYNGGSKDYNEGSKDYEGGSQDSDKQSKEYNGGSKDYNEGSKEYNGGSEECQSCGN